MKFTHAKLQLALLLFLALLPSSSFGQKPEWQGHIDWAANDTGEPNCKELYLSNPVLQECLVGGILTGNAGYGNRYCVIDVAIEAAYRNFDAVAMFLAADVAQCHNGEARDAIHAAGTKAVGDYLRSFDRPAWSVALDLAPLLGGE